MAKWIAPPRTPVTQDCRFCNNRGWFWIDEYYPGIGLTREFYTCDCCDRGLTATPPQEYVREIAPELRATSWEERDHTETQRGNF